MPGVVSLDTLKIHHSLKVRPYEPAVGYYDGNPFHEVAKEAARMVNAGFMLNVVQDPHKNIVGAVAGNLEKAHAAGVELCRKENIIDVHGRADLIITSPGGAPRVLICGRARRHYPFRNSCVCRGKQHLFLWQKLKKAFHRCLLIG